MKTGETVQKRDKEDSLLNKNHYEEPAVLKTKVEAVVKAMGRNTSL